MPGETDTCIYLSNFFFLWFNLGTCGNLCGQLNSCNSVFYLFHLQAISSNEISLKVESS